MGLIENRVIKQENVFKYIFSGNNNNNNSVAKNEDIEKYLSPHRLLFFVQQKTFAPEIPHLLAVYMSEYIQMANQVYRHIKRRDFKCALTVMEAYHKHENRRNIDLEHLVHHVLRLLCFLSSSFESIYLEVDSYACRVKCNYILRHHAIAERNVVEAFKVNFNESSRPEIIAFDDCPELPETVVNRMAQKYMKHAYNTSIDPKYIFYVSLIQANTIQEPHNCDMFKNACIPYPVVGGRFLMTFVDAIRCFESIRKEILSYHHRSLSSLFPLRKCADFGFLMPTIQKCIIEHEMLSRDPIVFKSVSRSSSRNKYPPINYVRGQENLMEMVDRFFPPCMYQLFHKRKHLVCGERLTFLAFLFSICDETNLHENASSEQAHQQTKETVQQIWFDMCARDPIATDVAKYSDIKSWLKFSRDYGNNLIDGLFKDYINRAYKNTTRVTAGCLSCDYNIQNKMCPVTDIENLCLPTFQKKFPTVPTERFNNKISNPGTYWRFSRSASIPKK